MASMRIPLSLFIRVRRSGILRTSSLRSSTKFGSSSLACAESKGARSLPSVVLYSNQT
jgi:hypothetical protein